jgi:hypothetical protein
MSVGLQTGRAHRGPVGRGDGDSLPSRVPALEEGMRFSGRALSLAIVMLALAVAAPGAAWAADGSVQVTVLEKVGGADEPLIGATVELKNVDGASPPMGRMTDVNGQALFPAVPAGSGYIVTSAMPGYGTVVRDDVAVVAGQTTQVVVALQGEKVEEVTVKGDRDVVEMERTETVTEISDDYFSDLPVLGREYQNVLKLAPGFNDTDGDGNPNVHGSRDRDFQMSVEGVNNVDPLTGKFMAFITPDAIEEIEIVDSGADASYGGAVGGYGRMRIKDGGNEFEGTANLFFRDSLLDNDLDGNRDPVDYGLFQPSFLLSGPVIKDNLWFLMNHEYLDFEQPVNLVAGQDFVQSIESLRSLDKLTWQFGERANKLVLQYSADPLEVSPSNVSSVAPPETGTIFNQGGPTFSLKWVAPYSPTLFWEATAARQATKLEWEPFDRSAVNQCVRATGQFAEFYDGVENFMCEDSNFGGKRSGSWYFDQTQRRQRWTYGIDGEKFINEWIGGEHRMKFGFNLQRVLFSREAVYRDRFRQTALGDPVALSTGSLLPGPNEPSHVLSQFTYAPKLEFSADTALNNGILSDESNGNFYAAYFTDTYTPVNNLFITIGIRYSREEIEGTGYVPYDPRLERQAWGEFLDECMATIPGANPGSCLTQFGGISLFTTHELDRPIITEQGVFNCQGDVRVINPYQCRLVSNALLNGVDVNTRTPETFNVTNNNLEPRLSVRWDPKNDGKTIVFANWGRFYGQTILLPFLFENGPDVAQRVFERNNDLEIISSSSRIQSAWDVSLVDRNVRGQHTDEWGVGFEREIAPETLLRLRYLNRRTVDQFQDVDINHRPVPFDLFLPGEDGSPPQITRLPDGRIPRRDCENVNGFADCYGFQSGASGIFSNQPDGQADLQSVSPFFGSTYVIGNQNESKYDAFILEINRRFYQNWEFGGSYVWSKAIGDAEDFFDVAGDDVTNQQDRQGFLAFDQRHVIKLNGRVFVPRWGGFRLGTAISYQTGLPYSIIEQRNSLDFPSYLSEGASGTIYDQNDSFQLSTFRLTYPTGSRNDQRNPPYWNFDVNFQKDFDIGNVKTTFQFEIYNLLNDNTQLIAAIIRSPFYDFETNRVEVISQPIAVRRIGRQFQVGLKFNFD